MIKLILKVLIFIHKRSITQHVLTNIILKFGFIINRRNQFWATVKVSAHFIQKLKIVTFISPLLIPLGEPLVTKLPIKCIFKLFSACANKPG